MFTHADYVKFVLIGLVVLGLWMFVAWTEFKKQVKQPVLPTDWKHELDGHIDMNEKAHRMLGLRNDARNSMILSQLGGGDLDDAVIICYERDELDNYVTGLGK
jgi:hypothetical protein